MVGGGWSTIGREGRDDVGAVPTIGNGGRRPPTPTTRGLDDGPKGKGRHPGLYLPDKIAFDTKITMETTRQMRAKAMGWSQAWWTRRRDGNVGQLLAQEEGIYSDRLPFPSATSSSSPKSQTAENQLPQKAANIMGEHSKSKGSSSGRKRGRQSGKRGGNKDDDNDAIDAKAATTANNKSFIVNATPVVLRENDDEEGEGAGEGGGQGDGMPLRDGR